MPGEALRLKFWEVAPLQRSIGITPFEQIRLSQNMLISEVAERMGWEAADYGELESGDIHASAKTILTFCKAMNCHPLDLYNAEAGPETPLPREILYSLVAMADMPDCDNNARARSLVRLELEHRRAKTMVVANREYFRPFLVAMGYAPDFRSYRAPLYDASRDKEDIGARMIMDLSLFEARMLLEQTHETYQMIEEQTRRDAVGHKELVKQKAGALFGSNGAEAAITGLSALMTQWKDKKALCQAFTKAPVMVGVPLYSDNETNPSQLLNDKHAFFAAVKRHMEFVPLLKTMNTNAQKAEAELQKFVQWLDKPKTRTLLDWYEDCAVLGDFAEHEEPLKRQKSRAQPIPG